MDAAHAYIHACQLPAPRIQHVHVVELWVGGDSNVRTACHGGALGGSRPHGRHCELDATIRGEENQYRDKSGDELSREIGTTTKREENGYMDRSGDELSRGEREHPRHCHSNDLHDAKEQGAHISNCELRSFFYEMATSPLKSKYPVAG